MFDFLKKKSRPVTRHNPVPLVEGEDFYIENGLYVFTALYHQKRGYCCGSGCRHCPYEGDAKRS